jgi:peptidoglycan/LPS O-acetylase OafA/YrhL
VPHRDSTAAYRERGFRPDIQALRAIAVGSVLLYHLWPGRVPGGFVGVDVFFVISGYLITGHLLRDLEGTGRVRLARFWVRRARRLLPASLLVLGLVAVATVTVVPLSQRAGFLREVLASTFYVENWSLARQSVDYLAADNAPSPVQHYWSLGAEEQFYVVVPLLLIAIAWLVRRQPQRRHVVLPLVLAALAVLSLALSIHQTVSAPGVAYFSTATRAWEFLLGGLLAALGHGPRGLLDQARIQATLGWAGLLAIISAAFLFDGSTAFPGYAAALPVLGAAAAIAAGPRGPVALLARLRPITFLGDISYAVYLWHWPLIVLVPAATGEELGLIGRCAILLVTIALAWASTRFVEEPLRNRPRSLDGRRPVLVVATAAALATAFVATLAVVGTAQARSEVDRLQARAEQLLADGDLSCLGANRAVHPRGCPDFGDVLVPAPAAAAEDDGNDLACWAGTEESTPRFCSFGRTTDPTLRVLAIGDSHNNSLIPAWRGLAEERGWSLDVTGRAGCSWSTGAQAHPAKTFREQCRDWKQAVAGHLADHPAYDLILTTSRQAGTLNEATGGETREEATIAALHAAWASQIRRGSVVVAVRDVPQARPDVIECVEREGIAAASRCGAAPDRAFAGYDALTPAVDRTPGSALIDLRDVFCTAQGCAPVIGNVVVYIDPQHVTATFARTLVPVLGQRLDRALARLRSEK